MKDKNKKSIKDFMANPAIVVKETNAVKGGEGDRGRSIDISYYN